MNRRPYREGSESYVQVPLTSRIGRSLRSAHKNVILVFIAAGVLVLFSCSSSTESGSAPDPGQIGRMAFVNLQGGSNHIYLMDIDSNGKGIHVLRLTDSSETENYPSWSPDGGKLLYQCDLNGSAIYVVNADGSNMQRLSPSPGFDATPDWSPDGSKIIYTRLLSLIVPNQIPQTEIHMMNADGSGDQVILPSSAFSVEPRWSVKNQIVFMSLMNGGQHIFTMNSDGSNIKQLTSQGSNGDPAWSPDGSRISFGSDREGGGKLNVYVMNADGSNVQQLTHFDVPAESGDTNWSSDGKKITFEFDISGHLQSDPNAYAEVWTMNADGSQQASTQQRCSAVGCAPRWLPKRLPGP